jgi:galactose mutarotase-like enzyme
MGEMEAIHLQTETSYAEICLTGGEITRWQCEDDDLLWKPDPTYWRRTSPILFPVIGWLNNDGIIIHGRCRPMTVHGFAKTSRFSVLNQTKTDATIELGPSAETADLYPFGFRLRIQYSLSFSALATAAEVFNVGPDPMPYGFGIHPGFRWPLPGGRGMQHSLSFASRESNLVPTVTAEGYISREQRQIPFDGKTLLLKPALFEHDVLCFLNAKSSHVTFTDGQHRAITVTSKNLPHWGIWSKPGAEFLCIQSWTSYGDAPDFASSIYEKPSMIVLEAGASRCHSVEWKYYSC